MLQKKYLSAILTLTLVISAFFQPHSLQADDKVPGVLRLPPRVYAMLTIPNINDMKERNKKSSLIKLWNDPEFEEFKDQIMSEVMEFSDKINQHIGMGIEDILKIPQGEYTIAYVQDSEGQLGAVSFLDFGDQEDNIYTLLEALKLGMDALNAEQSSQDIEGTEVTDFIIPTNKGEDGEEENNKESSGSDKHVLYFIKDTQLVMSNKMSTIKDVLARWDGAHEETFASNEFLKYIQERSSIKEETPSVTWFVNPIGLLKKVTQKYGRGNLQAQMMLGFLPQVGLNNFKAVGGSLFEATEKFEIVNRTVICLDQPITGIPAIFRCNTSQQAPPKWVPDNIASFSAMNWNVGAAYNSIEAMVDSIQGTGFFSLMVNSLQKEEDGPKIHIKKDLIDQMTGEVQVITLVDESVAEKLDSEDSWLTANMGEGVLFSVGLKDSNAIEDLIKSIIKSKGFPGEIREFQGVNLYEMKDEASGSHTGFTIHQDQLIMTSHIPLLEDVIRADKGENSLVDSDEYKEIAKHFPRETSIITFQKQEKQFKLFYKLAKSGFFAQFVPQLDFSTLPEFESFKKYLSTEGSYAIPDERGALMVSFSVSKK